MSHHPSRTELDQLAAEQAASTPEPAAVNVPIETALAYGATGEGVTRLVNLLKLLGYDRSTVAQGAPPVLDEAVLADVRAAQANLGVSEPGVHQAADLPAGITGTIVGTATWDALYAAAAAKAAQETPPA